MGTVFLVVLAIIVFLVVRGMWRAHDRINYANTQQALRDASGERLPEPPSWTSKRDEIEVFFHGVIKLAEHRGIPIAYTSMLLSQREFGRYVLGVVGAVERQGGSFVAQQSTAFETVQHAWGQLTAEEQAKLSIMPVT